MSLMEEFPLEERAVVHTTKDGVLYEHEIEGIVFRKKTYVSAEGVTRICYVALSPEAIEVCKQCIKDRTLEREYNYALVRRVVNGCWLYYPLSLVFTDTHLRVVSARKTNTKVPCGRWIRRTRQRIGLAWEMEHSKDLP